MINAARLTQLEEARRNAWLTASLVNVAFNNPSGFPSLDDIVPPRGPVKRLSAQELRGRLRMHRALAEV